MAAMYHLFAVLLLGCHLPADFALPTIDYSHTSAAVCQSDEEWRLGDQGEGCYCKPEYHVTGIEEMKPQLTCGVFTMRATFRKCQMKMLQAYFNQSSIEGGACLKYLDDSAQNTLSVIADLKNNTCGVQSSQNRSHVSYGLTLNITLNDGINTRHDRLNVRMSCVYELDMISSLNMVPNPIISDLEIFAPGFGTSEAYMALYIDASYLTPHQGSGLALSVRDTLYIGTFIIGGDDSEHVLVMTNCYATPTDHPDDPVKYYIIQDRCPNKADDSIAVHENGKSRMGRVSVQFFKFVGDLNEVYLHCALSLCNANGNCVPSCDARSRSAQDSLEITSLRIGPIRRSDIPETFSTTTPPTTTTANYPTTTTTPTTTTSSPTTTSVTTPATTTTTASPTTTTTASSPTSTATTTTPSATTAATTIITVICIFTTDATNTPSVPTTATTTATVRSPMTTDATNTPSAPTIATTTTTVRSPMTMDATTTPSAPTTATTTATVRSPMTTDATTTPSAPTIATTTTTVRSPMTTDTTTTSSAPTTAKTTTVRSPSTTDASTTTSAPTTLTTTTTVRSPSTTDAKTTPSAPTTATTNAATTESLGVIGAQTSWVLISSILLLVTQGLLF